MAGREQKTHNAPRHCWVNQQPGHQHNNEIKMNYDDVCDYNHADDDDVDQEGVNLSSSGH